MTSNGRQISLIVKTVTAVICVSVFVLALSSCSGSGGFFSGIARIAGQALRPVGQLIDANPIPLGDAVVSIRDFVVTNVTRTSRVFEAGRTDANGNFAVEIEGQPLAAIIIEGTTAEGTVTISGLVNPDREAFSKNLDAITSVACVAGLAAVDDGSISPEQLNAQRISNLEQAADQFLRENPVNFFDANSVTAAAQAVRASSADGATTGGGSSPTPTPQPAEPTPTPQATPTPDSGLNCQTGEFACADGFRICAEFACNGSTDCADGSDESQATCGEEASCCIATQGCPGETATDCAETCCCCPFGMICDQGNFANGCVAARTMRSVVDQDNPLSKLIIEGSYY